MVNGLGAFKQMAITILGENGLEEPKPDHWYPLQNWLNAFKIIANKIGPNTLFQIGKQTLDDAKWPPNIKSFSIKDAFQLIDVAYHMNHKIKNQVLFQNGKIYEGIGHYTSKEIEKNMLKIICENPYPCEFDKGLLTRMAYDFKPKGSLKIEVIHDDSAPCRKKNQNSCSYIVKWQ